MSDLKELLGEGIGSFEPRPGGLDRTRERVRARHRIRRLTAAIVALVVGVAGVTLLVIAFKGLPGSTARQAPVTNGPSSATPSTSASGHPVPLPAPPGTIELFRGRTNDHWWTLYARQGPASWELVLLDSSGTILFDRSARLDAAHPSFFDHVTWRDPGGPASLVFGLGTGTIIGLRVRTPTFRETVGEDFRPRGLAPNIRFFLADFGKVTSIVPVGGGKAGP